MEYTLRCTPGGEVLIQESQQKEPRNVLITFAQGTRELVAQLYSYEHPELGIIKQRHRRVKIEDDILVLEVDIILKDGGNPMRSAWWAPHQSQRNYFGMC